MTARWLTLTLCCSMAVAASAQPAAPAAPNVDDLVLVNCRLPKKIVYLGNRSYPVAGKRIRTTAIDCRIRGGEYVAYDRSDYATSLKFWMDEAKEGKNHDAEYYAAKLHEGTGNYKEAATWYQKAASAGHSASQFALATLYEKGLGVPADSAKALKLYRQAAGLPDNYVIVESGQYEALEQAAQELALREQEIEELQRRLDEALKQQTQDEQRKRQLLQQLDEQKKKMDAQKAEVIRLRSAVRAAAAAAKPAA
ncbi:MAG TPA: hypothetical protein VJ276_16590, partial [Thermoanaerobaculia bacterium]|nr:hypothetical protein [Thermoanaerobaculia bacterium]